MKVNPNDPKPSTISDERIVVFCNKYPIRVRDFVLHERLGTSEFQIINPLELLGTQMAVGVINKLANSSSSIARQFELSRLLAQCLEYRGNRRHLVAERWTQSDLRGDSLFDGNRTQLARDLSVEQAQRFKLVMAGGNDSEPPANELFWQAFSLLPIVDDQFDDDALSEFANQLFEFLAGKEEGETTLSVSTMRSDVKNAWDERFDSFALGTPKRQRRDLFRRLMSVAIRQVSTLMERVAFAFVLRSAGQKALERNHEYLTDRERKLFDLRYGSSPVLGNINIGFLIGYDGLYAELLNNLALVMVSSTADQDVQRAETELVRHIQLLHELRSKRRAIRADQRRMTRQERADKLPLPRLPAEEAKDARAATPVDIVVENELVNRLKQAIGRLKPRDRIKAQALIDAGGDRSVAATSLKISREALSRQIRQTLKPNLTRAIRKMKNEEGD